MVFLMATPLTEDRMRRLNNYLDGLHEATSNPWIGPGVSKQTPQSACDKAKVVVRHIYDLMQRHKITDVGIIAGPMPLGGLILEIYYDGDIAYFTFTESAMQYEDSTTPECNVVADSEIVEYLNSFLRLSKESNHVDNPS